MVSRMLPPRSSPAPPAAGGRRQKRTAIKQPAMRSFLDRMCGIIFREIDFYMAWPLSLLCFSAGLKGSRAFSGLEVAGRPFQALQFSLRLFYLFPEGFFLPFKPAGRAVELCEHLRERR